MNTNNEKAVPAVDAAKLNRYEPTIDFSDLGQMVEMNPDSSGEWYKRADVLALVAQQAARIEELEQQAPDLGAIGWAYTKLQAFGCGQNNLDSAMMLDRLNLMLLEGK